VFASGELERAATVAKNATVQRKGDRVVECFNLDAILSKIHVKEAERITAGVA
jgi:hypothetical protein